MTGMGACAMGRTGGRFSTSDAASQPVVSRLRRRRRMCMPAHYMQKKKNRARSHRCAFRAPQAAPAPAPCAACARATACRRFIFSNALHCNTLSLQPVAVHLWPAWRTFGRQAMMPDRVDARVLRQPTHSNDAPGFM